MKDEIKQAIADLLTHSDPDRRREAAEMLAGGGNVGQGGPVLGLAPVAALAAALRDDNKGVRDAASRSLCSIGGAKAARAIVEYIADANIVTRNLAAELLVQLGEVSVRPLFPYLQDPNQDIRKFAVDILGLIKSDDAVPHLLPLLRDPDPNVLVSAAEALGNIGSAVAVPQLIQAYDEYEFARAPVAEALGKIGDSRAEEFLLLSFTTGVNQSSFDPLVLYVLVEALSVTGSQRTFDQLQKHIPDVEGTLRHVLLHAVVRIAERLNLPLSFPRDYKHDLINVLHKGDVGMKISAIKSLAPFDESEVTQALLRALGESEQLDALLFPLLMERKEAFRIAVEELETKKGIESVSGNKLHRTKQLVSLLGKLALGFLEKIRRREEIDVDDVLVTRAFRVVENQWAAATEETRALVVDALFRLDGDRAVHFLDAIANDPDPWLRIHVIELLAGISDRRVPGFIARFLDDDDELVRESAAAALQSQGYSVDRADFPLTVGNS